MQTISDIIESFLLETLGNEISLCINRNELANYFSVAPSQINYVLSTRFTPERGYVIESRRGGGGSVTVSKIQSDGMDDIIESISDAFEDGISYSRAAGVIDRLISDEVLTPSEGALIKAAVTDKALLAPTMMKDRLRGSVLKSVFLEILKIKKADIDKQCDTDKNSAEQKNENSKCSDNAERIKSTENGDN